MHNQSTGRRLEISLRKAHGGTLREGGAPAAKEVTLLVRRQACCPNMAAAGRLRSRREKARPRNQCCSPGLASDCTRKTVTLHLVYW